MLSAYDVRGMEDVSLNHFIMNYDPQELKRLVVDEAKNLLIHATSEERDLLEFRLLDPDNQFRCIYGQMAEGCYSDRATDLIKLCAVPYSFGLDVDGFSPATSNVFTSGFARSYSAIFSPIEFYISTPSAKNDVLIEFLRGERETLTVDDL
jgi:hypothetical protein